MADLMHVRTACAEDSERCAEIYAPFVTETRVSFELTPPTPQDMATRIEAYGTTHGWFVCESNRRVIGFAYGSPHRAREAYQSSCDVTVYVDPVAARSGIGRALYEALFPHLKRKGYHAAFAGIALPNPASVGLHESMGFTQIGIYREVGWKLNGWCDVGWWQRLL